MKNQNEIFHDYSTKWEKLNIARFKYIDIAKYGNGEKFNSEALLVNVITEFKKLVQLNNTIDETLDKIKTKKKIIFFSFFIFKKIFL